MLKPSLICLNRLLAPLGGLEDRCKITNLDAKKHRRAGEGGQVSRMLSSGLRGATQDPSSHVIRSQGLNTHMDNG